MRFLLVLFLLQFTHITAFTQKAKTSSANTIITAALAKAKKQHKKVFVKFTASWCGWCHKMDNAMNDDAIKKFFTDNYVIVYLTVLETSKNKGAENENGLVYLKKYSGDDQGLPYWLVLDSDEKVLANSKIKKDDQPLDGDGNNTGCPTETNEISYFIRVLKNTSKLTAAQLEVIQKRFEKIKKG
jgi:thiol-disulfide isomerase/thioredoxin